MRAPPRALADRLADPEAPAAWFPVRVESNGRTPRRWRGGSRFLRFEPGGRSGTHVRAHLDVTGRGIAGDAVAGATAALLRGGALDHALQVIKDEIERSRR